MGLEKDMTLKYWLFLLVMVNEFFSVDFRIQFAL